ncbi:ATP-binding protein [Streptomyces apocyni]|uniref:ATP-binding protein n=1 Tax=Streptomyces apocyni TaxID=2654677 RepID=UPI0012EADE6D|nr:AAA family ATPase [Streptomyces apocyni]
MTPELIGRDHPVTVLRTEIARAAESHGGLLLVTGEAGIGKTTLMSEAADEARRLGALVLTGACWASDSAPGYWPWVQVVRGLRRAVDAAELAAAEEAAGGTLGVLLGEARAGAGPTAGGEDSAEAFRLYDAVTTALVTVSQKRPVVVVLDDLHWADSASLKLLEFAAGHAWFERLLLVGAYRDAEVEAEGHPLREQILPLATKATTLTLSGLDREETGALIARTAGRAPAPALTAEVHQWTGGNPFFVEQTARLWASGAATDAIAPGVREAVRRRLALLPGTVAKLLATGAVLGREFHRQVLAAVEGEPVAHVDRLLAQAAVARLVTPLGRGRYAFAHDLVRETLYEELADDAQVRHAEVVRALEAAPALSERVFPADRARHAYAAGDAIEPETAVRLLQEAAQDAGSRLALEEQLSHQRRAVERAVGLKDQGRRVTVILGLVSDLQHNGDPAKANAALDDALQLARRLDDPGLLARVALTAYTTYSVTMDWQRSSDGLLREAYDRLTGREGAAADRTTEELAEELSIRTSVLARRREDDEALGFSLWARHHAIWGPGTAPERVALVEELAEIARRTGDIEGESFARALHWVALLELGDPRFLDEYHGYVEAAERHGLPRMGVGAAIDQSIVSALAGRFAQAESFLAEAVGYVTPALSNDHVVSLLEHHRWALAVLQGRYEGLDELVRSLGRDHPCPRLLAGITAIERADADWGAGRPGRTERAGGEGSAVEYARTLLMDGALSDRGFRPLRLRFQAQAAAASGDPELCERARAALAPYAGAGQSVGAGRSAGGGAGESTGAGQWAVSMFGWDVSGPIAHWVAVCDAALGRWAQAAEGFTTAYRSAELLGARPWSVESRARLAQCLIALGDDPTALLAEVERDAADLGMRQILRRVAGLRAEASVSAPAPARTAAPAPAPGPSPSPANEFRFDGAVWNLAFQGKRVHMPDAKGLRDLRLLLSRPGSGITAVQLLAPDGGAEVIAAHSMSGDAVLDEEAKRQYKQRLDQLDEEIDRAAELGDEERAARYDTERAALLAELRSAAGLGGRTRRLGDEAERARKAVTGRIRDTLRKLDTLHPSLAAYLRDTVSTGLTCAYRPDQEIDWRL